MKESKIKDLTIRLMEEKDAVKASYIEAKSFSMPWKADDFIEMIKAPYAYYFVALIKDEVVGICGLRDIAGEGEITNVVVDDGYRRLGIGRKMLEKVIDQCGQLDIKDVTLEVRIGNKPAISLYEEFGFKEEGIRPNFYEKPNEDALIMWRRQN